MTPRSTPSIPVGPAARCDRLIMGAAVPMECARPLPCEVHDPEARPTPVEPEAPEHGVSIPPGWGGLQAIVDNAHAQGRSVHVGFEETCEANLRRLAVEPDGLPLDVPRLARALQLLWEMRDKDGHFVYDIPVPPDEATARALASAYQSVGALSEDEQPR